MVKAAVPQAQLPEVLAGGRPVAAEKRRAAVVVENIPEEAAITEVLAPVETVLLQARAPAAAVAAAGTAAVRVLKETLQAQAAAAAVPDTCIRLERQANILLDACLTAAII